ncbi:hypothetical protein [Celerinatantimonas sp. MCCC 1A17872]|uniref:hypothetical protein n=1 Tax=Celerinatantimonas sp. MCCC 1A17872 TaxID=3177514 RepID=UPI0038CB43A2
MAEVSPEDVAEVQVHANAAIMQAHTTIRQEIPAGTLHHCFINFVETMVHKIMSEFVAYSRLTKDRAIELFHHIKEGSSTDRASFVVNSVMQGGVAMSSLYMGREIIGWITNPRTLLSFLGAADLFVDGIGLGVGVAASLEGVLIAIFVAIAVLAVIVIIGHVTNNFEEAYLYFTDGFKSHSGYFRQWHEKIFGKVLGDDIYDVSDIAISARGLFEIKHLAPDELVQSFGLTIQKLLDKTHRAWRDLSRTAFVSEIAADVNTVSGHVEDAYNWVKEQFSSNQKEDKKHG